jgi:hypothetical protein
VPAAPTAPPAFARAIEARLATTDMHLADWWVDDLDGDHVPESIALVCREGAGLFLVQYGSDLLETPAEIDGRTPCPSASATLPAWRVATSGLISNYHRQSVAKQLAGDGVVVTSGVISNYQGACDGYTLYSLGIRDGQLVVVRVDSAVHWLEHGDWTREQEHVDYDDLTWSKHIRREGGKTLKKTSGPIVLITDRVRQKARLVGDSTLAATRSDNATTLHIHADRALVLRNCDTTPCQTTRVAKGDSEIAAGPGGELEVLAGPTKIVVHFEQLEGTASYPPPAQP